MDDKVPDNSFMPESRGPVLCIEVRHRVRIDFYRNVYVPKIEKIYDEFGEIRVLYYYPEPENWSGWLAEAAKIDLEFFVENGKKFTKIALVNAPDIVAQRWDFMRPLLGGEVMEFEGGEFDAALSWIRS